MNRGGKQGQETGGGKQRRANRWETGAGTQERINSSGHAGVGEREQANRRGTSLGVWHISGGVPGL